MTTDYDTPKVTDLSVAFEVKNLKAAAAGDLNLTDDLPLSAEYSLGADEILPLESEIDIVPPQEDEFTCSECFLIKHKSQLGKTVNGSSICRECL